MEMKRKFSKVPKRNTPQNIPMFLDASNYTLKRNYGHNYVEI